MNLYQAQIEKELNTWKKMLTKRIGLFTRISQGIQVKMRKLVPQKLQDSITVAFEKFIRSFMAGAEIFGFDEYTGDLTSAVHPMIINESKL
jgi:hypothetical protein